MTVAALLIAATVGAGLGAPPPKAKPENKPRKFLVGLGAVGFQVPPLRPHAVTFDRRYTGNTATMAGLGILGRYDVVRRITLELGVSSGSARYVLSGDRSVNHDLVLADLGLILWIAQANSGRLGVDMGLGGAFNSVRYQLDERSTQTFGFGEVRVGGLAELSFRRFAFLFALRAHGTFTDGKSRNKGPIFANLPDAEAPAPKLQLIVSGSLGVGYRF